MKISTTKQLGAYLKDVRLDNELSQADVAKKVGVRQDTVSNFELRAGTTNMDTFFKLLSALELDIQARLSVSFPRNISESIFSEMLKQLKKL